MSDSVENEYLCLLIAKAFGLPVPHCFMINTGKIKALAVERFDRKNPIVVEQVEKHEKSIALKGDLPQAVKQAVVQALLKEGDIARKLLKDQQVMLS
nr:HipA domain-containing protein [Pectobacterium aquaticum]